jgi:hypothetical protein
MEDQMIRRMVGPVVLGLLLASPINAFAAAILLITGASGTSEPGTTAAIQANFVTQATSLGHTVTVSDPVPASFAGFQQVWDFRFSESLALTPADRAQYLAYLQAGGGMFVMGENASFPTRNASVISLVAEAGGGALTFTVPASTQTVNPPFTGPDPIAANQITYAAPGGVTSPGTGSYITQAGTDGTGIFFGVGDLALAPAGALAIIFDVNWAQNSFDIPDSTNLLRNIIGGIQQEVDPLPGVIPEPASLTLLGLGLAGVLVRRYRSSRASR